ncbi:MAG: hypothetical protein LUH23_07040 [Oscillospiraceae bacterium]|nr:hypothetical protein [Oscillospiraceae bacterium]
MICYCDYCHYTFDSIACHLEDSIPESCPDCGKTHISANNPAIRKATEKEAAEYRRIREEILNEEQEGQW